MTTYEVKFTQYDGCCGVDQQEIVKTRIKIDDMDCEKMKRILAKKGIKNATVYDYSVILHS